MRPEVLKLEVCEAFKDVKKPTSSDMVPHQCPECDALRQALGNCDAEDIPNEILDRHRWDLPLLSDDAKHYYLVAWLIRSIEQPRSDYIEALIMAIDSDHRWSPAEPYTERQWRVLEAVLDYLKANVDELTSEAIAKAKTRLTG